MKGYMDSLNLMYVAFTRARDILFIGTPLKEKQVLNDTGDLMRLVLDQDTSGSEPLLHFKAFRSGNLMQTGEIPAYKTKSIREDQWKFDSYPVDQRSGSLRVRLRSDEYFVDEEGTYNTGLAFGTMMHQVFSKINSVDDVGPLLEKMQTEGLIPARERPGLYDQILEMISQPGVERWFSPNPKRIIHNERSILCGQGRLVRPDRVIEEEGKMTVVDFKFGSLELPRHVKQVEEYMEQLKGMGQKEVDGYVWYVTLKKISKVQP
jgi:ATP-dependent exoDNAse (exonuclease V) beta subunit